MQDVTYEPLMLQLPENPQASLDIFSQPHITLSGLCIYRKAINRDKHTSCGWYPTTGMSSTCKAKWFIPVYRLGEDGGLHFNEGDGMLLVWALRACSYKTKAEA